MYRTAAKPVAKLALRSTRRETTLSPKQIDELARTEVKVPLWVFLEDMHKEQSSQLESVSKSIAVLKEDVSSLNKPIARLPFVLIGAAAGRVLFGQLLGDHLRIRLHSLPDSV